MDNPRVRHWWGWVRHILRDGAPYLDRYTLRQQGPTGTNPWRVYLHRFHGPDAPGAHHNHPSRWSFSLILWGSYMEEVLDQTRLSLDVIQTPTYISRRVRWFNFIPADKFHRITRLHPGPGARAVWTLFVCGPLTGRGWGFFHAGRGYTPADPGK